MVRVIKAALTAACFVPALACAQSAQQGNPFGTNFPINFEENNDKKNWQEITIQMPAPPKADALIPFYVSAGTDNLFFVDSASVSTGQDGVVRYTLVVKTAGGATNISYEGMRCQTRERRFYAFGRSDGSWSKSRNSAWEKIQELPVNRQYAALFTDYFCPGGVMATKVETILETLRRNAGR